MKKTYQSPLTEKIHVNVARIMSGSITLNTNEFTDNNDDYQGAKQDNAPEKRSLWDD